MKEIFALMGLLMVVYFSISITEKFLIWIWSKRKSKKKLDIVNGIAQRDLKAGELVTISGDDWIHIMRENERTH